MQTPTTTEHTQPQTPTQWYAIKARRESYTAAALSGKCDEIFLPLQRATTTDGSQRTRAAIPHVLFIKTTSRQALELEREGQLHPESHPRFWIYRYPLSDQIQPIPAQSIELLRLLTADDTTRCRIYSPKAFTPGQRVRVTAGIYKGYEGMVKRIDRNKHVIVSIEGVCMVILPYIHPDLLQQL